MLIRMLKSSFTRGIKSKLLAILAITFGASLATAMLSVSLDVGDKMNQELKSYGSNIVVVPESESLPVEIDGVDFNAHGVDKDYIAEEDVAAIKVIFWRHNIVNLAPYLKASARVDGEQIPVIGTWFDDEIRIPTGEKFRFGVKEIKSWWKIDGSWIKDGQNKNQAMIGEKLANKFDLQVGDTINLDFANGAEIVNSGVKVAGIIDSGDEAERQIYLPLDFLQEVIGLEDKVDKIEVSALTTPVNDLARKAQADPEALSAEEFETWYCTAYVSSITFQIEEAIPGVVAKQVRQISESEGKVLNKIQLLMLLVTIAALISSGLGISSIMTTKVLERKKEIGLLKAIGASDFAVIALFVIEIVVVGIVGGGLGYLLGIGFAGLIGQQVFGMAIAVKLIVMPFILLLASVVALCGSISPLRIALKLEPAEVLHG
ncbi:putative ABC transport system permease protein [Orenia metallireducens]|jgi:putative ABC transport system permease protein|uniref:Putative ABC transport system permease protein n=1 Tax=Orenia metallireducens TaxID=1413210 RepID=A0A285I545_9FIRM|nr:ABC transporter permease [Orenia metallireducens]PRX19709.1 putative ABC transport system permease protein [Orenia metallireducens]SNY43069.1 putative ABC transport system permease protein [Orenia metallireducens]